MTAVQIIERDGEPRVSSEAIAGGSGVQHASTLRLIDDNLNDLQEFGQVRFEIRPGYNNSSVRFALLNEQQATLVMTYQRNTDQVREFKKALVRAFFENLQRSVVAAPALTEDEIVHQALAITARRVEVLEARVTELEPVAAHAETFRQADGLRTVGDVANDFKAHCAANFPKVKVRHRDVGDHAGRLGIVIRTDSVRHNQPTAQAIEAGWARPHRSTFDTNTRGEQTAVSTRLTPRGEARLWDGLAAWLGAHGTLDGARFRRSEVAS